MWVAEIGSLTEARPFGPLPRKDLAGTHHHRGWEDSMR